MRARCGEPRADAPRRAQVAARPHGRRARGVAALEPGGAGAAGPGALERRRAACGGGGAARQGRPARERVFAALRCPSAAGAGAVRAGVNGAVHGRPAGLRPRGPDPVRRFDGGLAARMLGFAALTPTYSRRDGRGPDEPPAGSGSTRSRKSVVGRNERSELRRMRRIGLMVPDLRSSSGVSAANPAVGVRRAPPQPAATARSARRRSRGGARGRQP
ncbi:MAG: hypothetical protein MZV70_63520 [Desulfobacterales bacterium]|nr:hypothetical protein [Desulfobacterales bacterium]